jgi:hypothetical protein
MEAHDAFEEEGEPKGDWEVLIRPWLEQSFLTLDKHDLKKGLPF